MLGLRKDEVSMIGKRCQDITEKGFYDRWKICVRLLENNETKNNPPKSCRTSAPPTYQLSSLPQLLQTLLHVRS